MADVEDERIEWVLQELARIRENQQKEFAAVHTKIDALRDTVDSKIDDLRDTFNGRLRALEQWKAWVLGAAAGASAVVTLVWRLSKG